MENFRIVDTEEERQRRRQEIAAAEQRDIAERNKRIKNKHFYQLGKQCLQDLHRLIRESPVSAEILFYLAQFMNRENRVEVSYSCLADATGRSKSTLVLAIQKLAVERWIKIVKNGRANIYEVNALFLWGDYADRRSTVFSAKINPSNNEKKESKRATPKKISPVKVRRVSVLSVEKKSKK
jgi:hypothetical protein